MNEVEEAFSKLSPKDLWSHVVYFSHITKISGSENEWAACEYIKKALEEYEIPVEVHEFYSFLSYPLKAKLIILSPEYKEIECITHSFSSSTPVDGIEAEICYIGSEKAKKCGKKLIKRKITLIDGTASPLAVKMTEDNGAAGQIHISGEDVIHEMIVTTIWGTPTPESLERLPNIPVISIRKKDGDYLKSLCEKGSVRARLLTKTWTGWKKIRIPVATIRGSGSEAEKYVIVGGHYDSWYEGATDNGTGNAACIELARLLATLPEGTLKRSVKIAWWPGHSTGRYSGSTWFADSQWKDLNRNAIAYLNVDSPGCNRAITYVLEAMAELRDYATKIINEVTGLPWKMDRPGRYGDESFWGLGIPSLDVYSMLPENEQAPEVGGSGGGWWWHTKYDTIDKANISILIRDLKVLLYATAGLCSCQILPFDFSCTADEILEALNNLQKGSKLDLMDVVHDAEELKETSKKLNSILPKVLSTYENLNKPKDMDKYEMLLDTVNASLMRICRIIIPMLYNECGRYDQEPAFNKPLIPALQPVSVLSEMKEESGQFRFLKTKLIREKNSVSDSINLATELIKELIKLVEEKLQ